MKNIKLLSLAFASALPLILAAPAWADDHNDSHGKGGKNRETRTESGGAAVVHGAGPHFSAPSGSPGGTRYSGGGFHSQPQAVYGGRTYTGHGASGVATAPSRYQTQNVQSGSGRFHGDNPAYSGRYYNRSNNYGGRWFPEQTHRDWDTHRQYYWNNHHYCWFNGGWLIIDGGFWPYGDRYPYWYNTNRVYRSYSYSDATVGDVQAGLARQGYFYGAVDGVYGPLTSEAIRRYQIDNGLPVTGRISPSLLNALGLY